MEIKSYSKKPIVWLYVLKLQEGNYYVGTTTDLSARFSAHWDGAGSSWTKKYSPISVVELHRDKTLLDEDCKVKELMLIHGINKVRGGSYTFSDLTREQRHVLRKELNHASGGCLECGAQDHWVDSCPERKKKYEVIKDEGEKIAVELERTTDTISLLDNDTCCARCGRNTHDEKKCYAKTHLKGYPLPPKEKKATLPEELMNADLVTVNIDAVVQDNGQNFTKVLADDESISFIKWSLKEYEVSKKTPIEVYIKNVAETIIDTLPSKITDLKFDSNEDPVFKHIAESLQFVISEKYVGSQDEKKKEYIERNSASLQIFLRETQKVEILEETKEELKSSLVLSNMIEQTKTSEGYGCNIQ